MYLMWTGRYSERMGKIAKKHSEGVRVFINSALKIQFHVHSYRLLFWRFCPLNDLLSGLWMYELA